MAGDELGRTRLASFAAKKHAMEAARNEKEKKEEGAREAVEEHMDEDEDMDPFMDTRQGALEDDLTPALRSHAPVRRRLLKKQSSTASVEICSVVCQCPICRPSKEAFDIADEDSDTPAQAMDVISPVPAMPLELHAALQKLTPSTRV